MTCEVCHSDEYYPGECFEFLGDGTSSCPAIICDMCIDDHLDEHYT